MKRFITAALSLLLVWTVTRLVAQEAPEPSFDPFSSDTAAEPAETVAEPAENQQRDRLLEIMRTKAELMDDSELDAAIQEAEAEIQELQARRLLTDARETLLRLIETYPETPAADDARRMLGREAPSETLPMPGYEEAAPSFTTPGGSGGFNSPPVFVEPAFDTFPES